MNEKLTFSIVIPAFNEEKNLTACIESAQTQKGNFALEVIVVDNNSSDNTSQVAQDLGARVIFEKQQGVGAARRTGVTAALGEYVVNLDADSHLPEDYLLNVLERFQKNSKLVCLGGQFYFYDGVPWQNFFRPMVFYILLFFARVVSLGKIGPTGNNMVFKKSDYEKTRGFNPELRYGEDAAMSRELSRLGEVKLDMRLKVYTSARRFKLDFKLFVYFLNFLRMCFVGKPVKNELHPAG